MITLLERAAAADAAAPALLDPRAAALLEWPRVTAQVARGCLTARAARLIHARRPLADPAAIALHHALADELRAEGDRNLWPPLLDVSQVCELLERPAPRRLEGGDLVHVATVAEELDRLRAHLLDRRDACPVWGEAAVQMTVFDALTGALRRALEPDGRLRDDASPLLARLRRQLGEKERSVRSEVNAAMSHARQAGWTTGDEVTLRGDRFCLPMRSGDSRRVDGIVHDRSATGATLFVEPAGVVRLANELASLRLEIAAEEARIIFELNRAVERAAPALLEAAALMVLLDAVRAGMLWSRAVRGHRPRLAAGGPVRIGGGRHPLLTETLGEGDPAAGRDKVVPLDLEIPADCAALVISGPNAGGKSVALKTVGVFTLLAQCGWDVPAREDTALPLVRRLLVDLGDDQSIAESLSSFSAHVRNLAAFLREAGPGVLVLCDEIGSGTDPQEGTALAFAVLEQLADKGALTLASTHFGLLKASVHDHPRMLNAAMDYDETDLRPLFTFRIGDPGTSHAFDIAARMGLPGDVLARARGLAGEERVQVEKLLTDLDRRARDLAQAQERVARLESELGARETELAQQLKHIDREKKRVLEETRRAGDHLVAEGRRAIERAVREIRSEGGSAPVVKQARDALAQVRRRLPEAEPETRAPAEVAEGDRVRIPHLGLKGRVVEVRGDKLIALADGLRLTVTRDAVEVLEKGPAATGAAPAPAPAAPETGGGWTWQGDAPSVQPELDLRGATGEEGWQRLDQLIDRAIPAGVGVLNVIHGHGTGRLRDHLHACLRRDPRVAAFREAGPGQGGGGATRVELADR